MKKLIVLLMALGLVMGATTAMAERAQVEKDDVNWIFWDGDGNNITSDASLHKVTTYSKNGKINLTVRGVLPEGATLPDKALILETGHNGFICTGETPCFHYVLTPSGHFNEKCTSCDYVP